MACNNLTKVNQINARTHTHTHTQRNIQEHMNKCNNNNILHYFSLYVYIYIYMQGAHKKFPDVFRMGTFIDSIHMKL